MKFKLPNKFKTVANNMELVGYGAFYNATENNGINLFFSKKNTPIDLETFDSIVNKGWEKILKGFIAEFGTKKKALEFITAQTEHYIEQYWLKVAPEFGGKQPLTDEWKKPFTIEYDGELMRIVALLFSNIKILTETKAIPNDEHNGMLYNYMKKDDYANVFQMV